MTIVKKGNARVSRLERDFSSVSRDSVCNEDDDFRIGNSVSDEDDGFDSGVGSDDSNSDSSELGEIGGEFCQVGNENCCIPLELYELSDLGSVLSLDSWNNCLIEEERFRLSEYLPDMAQETFKRTLKELFSGCNFHFGSPLVKFFEQLKGGLCDPRVTLYRQGLNFFQKKKHYHLLKKYQNSMVRNLLQIRESLKKFGGYGIGGESRVWCNRFGVRMVHPSGFPVNQSIKVSSHEGSREVVTFEPEIYRKRSPKGILKVKRKNPAKENAEPNYFISNGNHALEVEGRPQVSLLSLPRLNRPSRYGLATTWGRIRSQIKFDNGDDDDNNYNNDDDDDCNVEECSYKIGGQLDGWSRRGKKREMGDELWLLKNNGGSNQINLEKEEEHDYKMGNKLSGRRRKSKKGEMEEELRVFQNNGGSNLKMRSFKPFPLNDCEGSASGNPVSYLHSDRRCDTGKTTQEKIKRKSAQNGAMKVDDPRGIRTIALSEDSKLNWSGWIGEEAKIDQRKERPVMLDYSTKGKQKSKSDPKRLKGLTETNYLQDYGSAIWEENNLGAPAKLADDYKQTQKLMRNDQMDRDLNERLDIPLLKTYRKRKGSIDLKYPNGPGRSSCLRDYGDEDLDVEAKLRNDHAQVCRSGERSRSKEVHVVDNGTLFSITQDGHCENFQMPHFERHYTSRKLKRKVDAAYPNGPGPDCWKSNALEQHVPLPRSSHTYKVLVKVHEHLERSDGNAQLVHQETNAGSDVRNCYRKLLIYVRSSSSGSLDYDTIE